MALFDGGSEAIAIVLGGDQGKTPSGRQAYRASFGDYTCRSRSPFEVNRFLVTLPDPRAVERSLPGMPLSRR